MEKMPIYIKVDNYEDVLDLLSLIKSRMNAAKNNLARIKDIKEEEETKIRIWEENIKKIEEKIASIDSQLLEP